MVYKIETCYKLVASLPSPISDCTCKCQIPHALCETKLNNQLIKK